MARVTMHQAQTKKQTMARTSPNSRLAKADRLRNGQKTLRAGRGGAPTGGANHNRLVP